MTRRTICVVTGSRADYGLLRWLMQEIRDDPALALQTVVTGAHLEPAFGLTVGEIEADGFAIDARVPMDLAGDSPVAVAAAMGRVLSGIASELDRLRPDVVVLLGDRYEVLAAACAAVLVGRPIAHIHGGELTEGAMDDSFRHAVTKLAHLHFAAAKPYAQRILQMGETSERVFVVGALGVDAVRMSGPAEPAELDGTLGLALRDPVLLVTYHPVTRRVGTDSAALEALLDALDRQPKARVVITGVNADPGRAPIARRLADYAAARAERVSVHDSLGQRAYLSVMRCATAVVGNSSSGLVEAPAFGVPTVNIGKRQAGRLKARSVIDCGESADEIAAAIARARDPAFKASYAGQTLPYGGGGVARTIASRLKSTDLAALRAKPFRDLPGISA